MDPGTSRFRKDFAPVFLRRTYGSRPSAVKARSIQTSLHQAFATLTKGGHSFGLQVRALDIPKRRFHGRRSLAIELGDALG